MLITLFIEPKPETEPPSLIDWENSNFATEKWAELFFPDTGKLYSYIDVSHNFQDHSPEVKALVNSHDFYVDSIRYDNGVLHLFCEGRKRNKP